MFSFNTPSMYEMGSYSDYSYDDIFEGVFGNFTKNEAKASSASESHKEAERRRRKRINSHMATLKSILPNAVKTDKASLLGEAVSAIRELKKKTTQLSAVNQTDEDPNPTASFIFPNEIDELKVCHCQAGYNPGLMQATLCCQDRPNLMLALIQALESVAAKVVRAEMSTVGGRIKIILWVQLGIGGDVSKSDVSGLEKLRRALKVVVDESARLVSSSR